MGWRRHLRWGTAATTLAAFFFYFVPVIPAAVFRCSQGLVCLTNNGGLESLGYSAFHWGAFYSFEEGYFSPIVSNLTAFGVLLFVALPFVILSMLLVSPELSHTVSRLRRH
jgi:hypothetical protein